MPYDSRYNAAAQANTSKRERYILYNFRDKIMANQSFIRQWEARMKSAFKWTGLPETIDERCLEDLLQDEAGFAVWFKHNDKIYATFAGLDSNNDNVNLDYARGLITNTPLKLTAHKVYFKNNLKHEQDAVLMRNVSNILTMEELVYARYARLMTETDLTTMLALIQSRAMIVAMAEDDDILKSLANYIDNLETGNIVTIKTDTSTNDEAIKMHPYAASMHQALTDINEASQFFKASMMQDLGISANNNQKREAIMSGEADLITTGLTTLIDAMLKERKAACEEINALWGLNVNVELDGVWRRAVEADGINMEEDNGGIENEESMGEDSVEEAASSGVEETGSGNGELERTDGDSGSSGSDGRAEDEQEAEDGAGGTEGGEEVGEEHQEETTEVEVNINIDKAEEVIVEETEEEVEEEVEEDDEEDKESE